MNPSDLTVRLLPKNHTIRAIGIAAVAVTGTVEQRLRRGSD